MTAQGGDILAWLDTVISIHANAAQRACEGGAGRWYSGGSPDDRHVEDWELESDVIYSDDDVTQAKALVYNEVHPSKDRSVHIALNDPASVLRRCAADRKLIELHQVVPDHGRYSEAQCPADCDGEHAALPVCASCRTYAGDPVTSPCPTLHTLAEGYGWTKGER
ncbi:DUF6221 family protein [Streptomyces sp. NBC_01435]|uniref:DUF6221 family protein n=1 Tax=Streptomyces sp. NBC_01435 TaxID=2903865 RepID=UPI002E369C31|nr:DUF6221 family protein [Streptomyces sp. NBC_01435]